MAKTLTGPADLYPLPPTVGFENHDLRKQRLPNYSFGVRTTLKDNSYGPGPNKYNSQELSLFALYLCSHLLQICVNERNFVKCSKNLYKFVQICEYSNEPNVGKLVRYGVSKANRFTIAPKTYLKDKYKSPGPMAYQLREYPFFKGSKAPAYSMGEVNTFFFKNCAPAPNKYGINDRFIKLRAPEYSIGVKKYLKELVRSPGPASYTGATMTLIRPESPKYTIAPRTEYAFKLYGPGSNCYNRIEYKPGKRAPTYSFGTRHSPRSGTMIVPCDNI